MARLARVTVPGLPHLVTSRGLRGARVFFAETDYAHYRDILTEEAREAGLGIIAWCLLPDHVHLILVPSGAGGLSRVMAQVHWRYAKAVNAAAGRKGHLFRERFGAVVVDDHYLAAARLYVLTNPVRAGIVQHAADWPWVSAHDAELPLPEPPEFTMLRRAEAVGRPLGSPAFIAALEERLNRRLAPAKRGRPRKE